MLGMLLLLLGAAAAVDAATSALARRLETHDDLKRAELLELIEDLLGWELARVVAGKRRLVHDEVRVAVPALPRRLADHPARRQRVGVRSGLRSVLETERGVEGRQLVSASTRHVGDEPKQLATLHGAHRERAVVVRQVDEHVVEHAAPRAARRALVVLSDRGELRLRLTGGRRDGGRQRMHVGVGGEHRLERRVQPLLGLVELAQLLLEASQSMHHHQVVLLVVAHPPPRQCCTAGGADRQRTDSRKTDTVHLCVWV
jgi:hypothetical protein